MGCTGRRPAQNSSFCAQQERKKERCWVFWGTYIAICGLNPQASASFTESTVCCMLRLMNFLPFLRTKPSSFLSLKPSCFESALNFCSVTAGGGVRAFPCSPDLISHRVEQKEGARCSLARHLTLPSAGCQCGPVQRSLSIRAAGPAQAVRAACFCPAGQLAVGGCWPAPYSCAL